jgi:adenylylsulfate kinase
MTTGIVIWLTGLPASGKSSLAREIEGLLREQAVAAIIMDSDELRAILTPQAGYGAAERDWFYTTLARLAAWLAQSGVNVLVAATGHRRVYRDRARQEIERFAEVYVACPLAVCQERDPKGIYALARQGKADEVPGVGVVYEPPLMPEAAVDTGSMTPAAAASAVVGQLQLLA